jgi:hypothetical protein
MPEFQGQSSHYVKKVLESCPETGSGTRGVHRWLLRTANLLRHDHPPESAAQELFEHISRRPKPGEIRDTVAKSYQAEIAIDPAHPVWPRPDPELIDAIVSWGIPEPPARIEDWLADSQPIPATDQIVAALFPPDSFICVGLDAHHALSRPLAKWHNLERFQFLVPNPMRGYYATDANGRKHQRCLLNTAGHRFLVTDFDLKTPELAPKLARFAHFGISPQQAMLALIAYMAEVAPLSLVVYSGHWSLQAWFWCQGENEQHLANWFSDACLLGADPAGWVRCQYFRMPGATRAETGQLQKPLFFNPEFSQASGL